MTDPLHNASLQHLINKQNEGRTATEERTLRVEHLLSALERRVIDLEQVVEEQLEARSMVSSVAPYEARSMVSSVAPYYVKEKR